tara:strand:- start:146 stop:382 length:237 start_codon:yes stop_codon:yes gene_type:complete
MTIRTNNIVDIIDTTTELENLENDLTVEVSKLIRESLENSSLDFIGGNDLDILIDTNVDIESITSKALIYKNKLWEEK